MLTEVMELRNDVEARVEAAKRVGRFLQDHASKLWTDEHWKMDVTDENGLILFVILVQAMKSAATSNQI
jgi:hypothetical protein